MPKIEKYLEYPQDTRWATDEEIMSPLSSFKVDIANPPFTAAGLILKSDGKTVYVDGMDHHSMILGSTGSGKSRLLCMPMIGIMANAGESFIATDTKGELFKMTSGFVKEQGYQVVVLNFRDVSRGDMWNPLLIPYELYQQGHKDQAMSLLNDLVMTLTAADSNQERFWTQMAQSLILANILLLFETGKREEIHMHSLSRLCLDYGRPKNQNALYQLLEYMNPDSIAAMNYAGVCVDAEKTQSSIMGVVHSVLRVFNTQEGLLRMMADSTFDMRSFGRKKTAVYLVIPDEKSTFHFLVSTFTKQCYEMLISEAHKEESMALPVRVNFMLDEFANLPQIPDMPNMISAARSRNIRFHLVIQSMNQLESKYGRDADTISSNCENWVYLNSKEYDCLEEISKRCGNLLDNRNQIRPLITPSRLQRLDKERGEALIFHGRHYPYITYLADISKYNFKVCTPMEMDVKKRRAGTVFHVDRILQELKEGKRAPLFYEADDNAMEESVDAVDDWAFLEQTCSAEIRLRTLYTERGNITEQRIRALSDMETDSAEFWKVQRQYHRKMLYYLLSSKEKMQQIQAEMRADIQLREQLQDAYEAEETYRNTELIACCGALLGESASVEEHEIAADQEKEEYQNWLLKNCEDTILHMADQEQMLVFYPVNSERLNMTIITGAVAVVRAIQNREFSSAWKMLSYVNGYRDCFFQYPELGNFMYHLHQLLDCLRQKSERSNLESLLEDLRCPVSFQEREKAAGGIQRFYRRQQDNPQDKALLTAVLRYCEKMVCSFQKSLEDQNRQ